MKHQIQSSRERLSLIRTLAIATLFAAAPIVSAATTAPPPAQQTFESAQAAADALMEALRNNNTAALTTIFGPDSDDLVSSGDPVADANNRALFVAAYDTAHELVTAADGSVTLELGDDGWPTPIPIVQADGKWHFDTEAGIDEIVYRRIGHNELGTIASCLGIAAAQQDYAAESHDGQPTGIYAQKLLSDPGKHDGLYWKPAEGERASPIGPFIAEAAAQGYRRDGSGVATYHGYVYKLLTAQGPAAQGGAKQYLEKGLLTGGFGVVAYPVDYQASGVATFIVNQEGVVYQKDLGPDTVKVAAAITTFNPDNTWTKVADVTEDSDEADDVDD